MAQPLVQIMIQLMDDGSSSVQINPPPPNILIPLGMLKVAERIIMEMPAQGEQNRVVKAPAEALNRLPPIAPGR